jgi:hypothetical protein
MRLPQIAALAALATTTIACGGDGTGPAPDPAQRQSQRFAVLADSLAQAGESDGAQAMRAFAELIRLSGRVSSVSAGIDGDAQSFNALAVQLGAPSDACGGDECAVVTPRFTQLLLAWRGESLDQTLVFVADTVGTLTFDLGEPTFVEGPGDGSSGDPFLGTPAPPHVLGAYAESRSERLWAATQGTLVNGTAVEGVACPAADQNLVPPGVSYVCKRADFVFAADATLRELPVGEGDALPSTQPRTVTIAAQPVAGLALTINGPAGPLAVRHLLRLVARTGR